MKLLAALLALFLTSAAVAQTDAETGADTNPDAAQNIWNLDLSTGGRVTIQLRPDIAPNHVERIRTLSGQGFYDGLIFHRVIPGFMAQGGDPQGTGQGGSQLPDLKSEFSDVPHLRGTVSMARAQSPDSANSQFFIVFQPRTQLDGEYTVIGRVTGGMQYVDAIATGEPPANPSRILKARIGTGVPLSDFNTAPDPVADLKSQLPPGATTAEPFLRDEAGAERVAEELGGTGDNSAGDGEIDTPVEAASDAAPEGNMPAKDMDTPQD